MAGGKLTCPRCHTSFLPLSAGGEVCPHCGAEVGTAGPRPAAEWYYTKGGAPVGRVPAAELKRMAETGQLLPTDFVRQADSDKWVEAGKVRGLFPAAPLPPFEPPAPAPRVPRTRPRERSYELIVGLGAAAAVTGAYLVLARRGAPAASSAVGYALGIAGFLLMVATETLYTVRKRVRGFHRGKMSTWLKIHIVTGILGPCLVLLHSGGQFHGLAGVLAALTCVIVASGFVGRYIYTAVPRTLDGVEVTVRELEERIAEADRELAAAGIDLRSDRALAAALELPRHRWRLVFGRGVRRWLHRRRMRRALRNLKRSGAHVARFERLLVRRYDVQVQIASLALVRRLLATWHVLHIPLGAAVFTLAFAHIAGALYYSALTR